MGSYTHLTIEEREEIMCLRRQGKGVNEVARAIGRHGSTVSRELARNSCGRGSRCEHYRASTAQRRYGERRRRCRRARLLDDPERLELVRAKVLEGRWSPEQLDDTVNLLFTICANESAPIALTYFHRFRQRFSTVFGYSVPLLSRGRSFSR